MIRMFAENVKARDVLTWIGTLEEERTLAQIQEAAASLSMEVYEWTAVSDWRCLTNTELRPPNSAGAGTINDVLRTIESYDGVPAVFVLQDMDILLERLNPTPEYAAIARRLKNLSRDLKSRRLSVVLLSSNCSVPREIEAYVRLLEFPLPDAGEFLGMISDWLIANGFRERCRLDEVGLRHLAQAFCGLTSEQAFSVLAHSLVRKGVIDAETFDYVVTQKSLIIKATGILELVETGETLDDVGGFFELKRWISKRVSALSQAASDYGVPKPKGVLLVGISGTGKSLTAKAIAKALRLPLLRLDPGRLFGSLVGESEARLRLGIQIVERVAPCVLWIDELEKALGGMTGPSGDGGLSRRMSGTILTWLQERTAPVFVAATANDIGQLPPELLRKGRWDELFFVELPTIEERREILQVQLRRHGRNPDGLVSERLLMRMDKFSGAEIEQTVVEALFEGFADGQRAVTLEDLERAATHVVPIAEQMQAQIEALREWGRRHARPAS